MQLKINIYQYLKVKMNIRANPLKPYEKKYGEFSHEDFVSMIRSAKQRKSDWEQKVGEKLDAIQRDLDSKKRQTKDNFIE